MEMVKAACPGASEVKHYAHNCVITQASVAGLPQDDMKMR